MDNIFEHNNPLKEATMEQLWQEICERTNNCLFVFSKTEKEKNIVYCDMWYHASPSELMGLFQLAKLEVPRRVLNSLYASVDP